MVKKTKTCRVCGKEYKACNALRNGSNTFRWQEVACSPECGAKYLAEIVAARNITPDNKPIRKKVTSRAKRANTTTKNTDVVNSTDITKE